MFMVAEKSDFLAKKLKELMAIKGTTQKILAERIGIRQPTVSHYLAGEVYPKVSILIKIAQFFHISLYELTGLESLKNIEQRMEIKPALTEDEKKFLDAYNSLPENDWRKKAIEEILLKGNSENKD
jgi:transcriptional regulator with XRE-family HTH domain